MDFTFVRFQQVNGIRQFAFRSTGNGDAKRTVVVSADLGLARKYDVSV